MKMTKQLIEQKGYNVIYGDTDSTFVAIEEINDQQTITKLGKELAHYINDYWQGALNKHNLQSALEIEFETHYQPFFMPTLRGEATGSKKRYAGIDQNGQLIFKGLEAARGDWTQLAREFQTELYTRVFTKQAVEGYIQRQVTELKRGSYDHKLVYRKRLGQDISLYQRNIPPHVRAVLDYQLNQPGFTIRRGDWVSYVISLNGPVYITETTDLSTLRYDYQHYIDKQLRPIVDAIEGQLSSTFSLLVNQQQSLF